MRVNECQNLRDRRASRNLKTAQTFFQPMILQLQILCSSRLRQQELPAHLLESQYPHRDQIPHEGHWFTSAQVRPPCDR